MSLFGRKEKQEIEFLKSQLSGDQLESIELQKKIQEQRAELCQIQGQLQQAKTDLQKAKSEILDAGDAISLQSYGIYTPRYSLMNSEEYKTRLVQIRSIQKDMIKTKTAVLGSANWTLNGSVAQGKKMVADMQKLLLRAFNSECDDVIEHVKYNNLDSSLKRINSSRDAISKLGAIMQISIAPAYYKLKIDEMYLAFEYQRKKEQEKEEQKEARARMREEAKLAKEIEEERKKLEKEQKHYQNALKKITEQLKTASDEDRSAIEEKKAEIESQLQKIDADFKNVDYREANQRAGYVYVISNIGSFGENVYKIGMTRRLDPMDRVDELGDASVPFDFDVHAMIFSDDAPKLEAALHQAFADRKLNFVNQRREFFNVTLDEIKAVVKKNFDKSVEFIDVAPAEQYRESQAIKNQSN